MSQKSADWTRLDNAAKIFPPTSNKQDTKVFRFACQLSEWVDRDILQQATERSLDVFPIFRSVLKHGLFWYYLEKTELVPVVEPEYRPPCGQIYDPSSRNLLFEVSCYRNRINLEVYHSLTDGTGAVLQQLGRDEAGIAMQTYDLDELEEMRMSWGVFRDRRPEYYRAISTPPTVVLPR